MSGPPSEPDPEDMKTLLRIIGRGVLLLVGAVVAAYVLKGAVGWVNQQLRTKPQVRADIEHGLQAGVNDATEGRQALRRTLQKHGAPTHSWQELRCGFSTRDAGWIAQAYLQECEVRAVDLWAVDAPTSGTECTRLIDDWSDGMPQYSGRVRTGSTDALTAEDSHWSCPSELATQDSHDTNRPLSGSMPEDLSTSPGWVVAETTTEVSRTEIGCSPWSVLFCSQPFAEPVLPRD